MALVRLLDLLNKIDDAIENEQADTALSLILTNWDHLNDPAPLRERTALLLATLGRNREALQVYTMAARHYSNAGYPTRALAAIKQMQNLNPAPTQLLDHFTTLYSVRSPFLEKGRRLHEFPAPEAELTLAVDDASSDLDDLLTKVLQRALSTEGIAERPQALPPLTLLSLLPPKALRRLLDLLDYEIFAEAQEVIGPTPTRGDLFWSVSSDLLVTDGDDTFRIPPGAMLGLSAFGHDEIPNRHTVVGQKGSECLRLSRSSFQILSEEFPDFPNRLATLRRHALTEGIFHRHPIFKNLHDTIRNDLIDQIIGLKLPAGTFCLRQGKVSPGLYILLDGHIDLFSADKDIEVTVDTLRSGQMFGEVGLVKPCPVPISAITTSEVHLLFLARKDFDQLLATHEDIRTFLQERSDEQLAAITETLETLNLAEPD